MRHTLDSVVGQSVRPGLWVIVDDGSTDDTPAILAEYEELHDWIRVVRRADRGHRKVGGGVVDTFNEGWQVAREENFEFLCKLDMDLILPPQYFEQLMAEMDKVPRLGTFSGKSYQAGPRNLHFDLSGELISEGMGDETSIGASKFYRRQCFEEIGGFVSEVMWDGIDCHRCRMLGWIARSSDDPRLRFIHLRPMGSSDRNILIGRQRHGAGQWFLGTHPLYFLATVAYRLRFTPVMVGGLAMLWGWLKAAWAKKPRYGDPEFRRFLHRYQLAILLKGKKRATAELDARQEPLWRSRLSSGS